MDERKIAEIPELADLRLVMVYTDDLTYLISLKLRIIIASGENLQVANADFRVPQFDLHSLISKYESLEEHICRKAGLNPEDGFPGWDVILNYLEKEQLINYAESLGLESEDLDDLVYDLAQNVGLSTLNTLADADQQEKHITDQEQLASEINNSGIEEQIGFLLQHNAEKEVRELLAQIARDK